MSKQCLITLKNLSTIRLIYFPLLGAEVPPYSRNIYQGPKLKWNEVKDVAIGQLRRSLADGPKRLKVMVLLPLP